MLVDWPILGVPNVTRSASVPTIIKMRTSLSVTSAVAERPRDALCPSIVSFNNTSSAVFYYCYLGFRFTTAYN